MVRPRGGRASPRYYYIKEGAEAKFLAAIAKKERTKAKKNKPKISRIKQSIYNLYVIGDLIDNEFKKIQNYLKEVK
jgi:hypothetical protein